MDSKAFTEWFPFCFFLRLESLHTSDILRQRSGCRSQARKFVFDENVMYHSLHWHLVTTLVCWNLHVTRALATFSWTLRSSRKWVPWRRLALEPTPWKGSCAERFVTGARPAPHNLQKQRECFSDSWGKQNTLFHRNSKKSAIWRKEFGIYSNSILFPCNKQCNA